MLPVWGREIARQNGVVGFGGATAICSIAPACTRRSAVDCGGKTMARADDVKASIKVCMFDLYGTVVDMQTGLTEAATPFLAGKGWQGDPNSFVTWWRRTHFENSMIDALLHREHTSYREIGHRSVALVLERAGIPYTLDEVRDLVAHIERLRPFPEVPEALVRLQTRYPLVVLSNGDPDMLETAKSYHGIPFDRVISVAVANAFKPHVATYTKAAEIVGVRMEEVLFVANHSFDCIGAKSAGMRTAFIDRRRRPFGITPHQPDLIMPSMTELADALV
jgi:2-haloacid dehalogenase